MNADMFDLGERALQSLQRCSDGLTDCETALGCPPEPAYAEVKQPRQAKKWR